MKMSNKDYSPYTSTGTFGRQRHSELSCYGLPPLPDSRPSCDAGGPYWRSLSYSNKLARDLDP